ncbi:hypothetical protein AAVH_12918 [Aphelenchoides avenae]|nr:hypothetical protein AAVH_12918 [Aphelenchus avenae]
MFSALRSTSASRGMQSSVQVFRQATTAAGNPMEPVRNVQPSSVTAQSFEFHQKESKDATNIWKELEANPIRMRNQSTNY